MTDWLARAREIAPLLAAAAPRIEEQRRIPEDVLAALHASGLMRLLLPRSFGGGEIDPASYAEVLEALACADGSTAWCVGQANGCSMSAAHLPPSVAAKIFEAPGTVMAWGPGSGQAVAVEGGYKISGTWSYASGGRHATWLAGRCQISGPAGGKAGARTFVFPAASARWEDIWQAIGLKGTASDRYSVADLFVPADHSFTADYTLVPEEGDGRYEKGALYCFPAQSVFAGGFAGVTLGLARGVLDAFLETANSKTPRGSTALLREDPVVQLQFGRSEVRVRAARAFLLQSLREAWDAATPPKPLTLDQRVALRMAITHAMLEARDAVDAVYHAVGASAVFAKEPYERRFRDMHAAVQHLQARQQHFMAVGRHLFGLEIDTTFV